MTGFVIGSVYSLKNKPNVVYLGDHGGVLHFRDFATGLVYTFDTSVIELEESKANEVANTPEVAAKVASKTNKLSQ